MEVFSPCFEPGFFERVYPQVETLQQILGDVQDSNMAIERLEVIPKSIPTAEFASKLRDRRTVAKSGFAAWREQWDSDGIRS